MKNQCIKAATLLTLILITVTPILAFQSLDEIGQGSFLTTTRNTGYETFINLPLKHTSVHADISGFIARVTVEQQFSNTQDSTIEAIYVFPLPDKAAVDAMEMHIGDRVIEGIIKKRDEAQKIYRDAKRQGRTAALLTQERPNIFTQAVANILPGDDIRIQISYVQTLKYDHGTYEFNFPMVVGPRYIPGNPIGRSGSGWAPDTDQVPDASHITPPVLEPGMRSGHDIEICVHLNAGVPIQGIRSPSHQVIIDSREQYAEISLEPFDTIVNKDFILRYDVAGTLPESAILTHAGPEGRFFSLMIQPQHDIDLQDVTPRELIFVVDCSGSMHGAPLAKAKEAMRRCIRNLHPDDSFQIIRFSSSASRFSPYPIPNTPGNVRRALQYIDTLSGSGGTMMIEGIKAALNYSPQPDKMRIVLFMTDGFIGNEKQILAAIQDRIGSARLFSFGVGSSVNHYLLDRMAEVGRGTVQYVRPDEETETAVNHFYERIENPLLTDIRVDWNGLDVREVYPPAIPDLFSAQPVILVGKYGESGSGTIRITGKYAGEILEQQVHVVLPESEPENDVLGVLWARTRIKALMSRMYHRPRQDLEQKITDLALKFKLMSQYTAFVAVSKEIRNVDGKMIPVVVPIEIPDMVDYHGIFGAEGTDKIESMSMGRASICTAPRRKLRPCAIPEPAYNCMDEDEIVDSDEMIIPKKSPVRPISHRTLTTELSMISGKISALEVNAALKKMQPYLEKVLESIGISATRLTIQVDAAGHPTHVEIVKTTIMAQSMEQKLLECFESRLVLNRGPGSFTVSLLYK